jgi:hypothetical protein
MGQLEFGGEGHSLPLGARLTPEGASVGVELQGETSANDQKQHSYLTHLIRENEIVGLAVESDPRASRLGRVLVDEERKPWGTRDLTRGVDTAETPSTCERGVEERRGREMRERVSSATVDSRCAQRESHQCLDELRYRWGSHLESHSSRSASCNRERAVSNGRCCSNTTKGKMDSPSEKTQNDEYDADEEASVKPTSRAPEAELLVERLLDGWVEVLRAPSRSA